MSDNRLINWLRSKIGVPDLVKLLFEVVTWRKLLFNRITVVFVVILVVLSGGVWYVSANSTGVVEGEVVTEDGQPVANADITLRTLSFGAVSQTISTTTDSEGRFRFDEEVVTNANSNVDLDSVMEFRLIVEQDGEEIARKHMHQLFQGQHRNVEIVVSSGE
ncbi:DUF6795 domain-containing protein [Halovenus marina]|uniref:DUF6795 domain-containing protein n=1 Tax=Halovenus marina TaxID=3396621 RepID=UPI003F55B10E